VSDTTPEDFNGMNILDATDTSNLRMMFTDGVNVWGIEPDGTAWVEPIPPATEPEEDE
jgi:hypothetical protein